VKDTERQREILLKNGFYQVVQERQISCRCRRHLGVFPLERLESFHRLNAATTTKCQAAYHSKTRSINTTNAISCCWLSGGVGRDRQPTAPPQRAIFPMLNLYACIDIRPRDMLVSKNICIAHHKQKVTRCWSLRQPNKYVFNAQRNC